MGYLHYKKKTPHSSRCCRRVSAMIGGRIARIIGAIPG